MIGNILVSPPVALCEHLLLIFLLIREVHRRLVPIVLAKTQFEYPELVRFFQTMEPELTRLYPLVDQAIAERGRRPVCHHFQLRFFIFYLLAGFPTLEDARVYINENSEWREHLKMPVITYQGSTLSRFLARVGEETWQQIEACLVRVLVKYRLVALKSLIIDGFPIISHLNTQKCLKHFSFDAERFVQFFQQLDLSPVLHFFDNWRYVKYSTVTHLRLWLFQHLWGYSSTTHLFRTLTKKPAIALLLVETGHHPTYESYRRFIKRLKAGDQWPQVKFFLTELLRQQLAITPSNDNLEHWQGLLDNQHQLRDPGSQLNYCVSKKLTYHGREGGLVTDGVTELPLFGWVQGGARIGNEEFKNVMERASDLLPQQIRVKTVVGDGEFDTDANQEACQKFLGATLVRLIKQDEKMGNHLPRHYFLLRLGVERAISRLSKLNRMQRPPVLKDQRVKSYVHLGIISLQLLAIYSAKSGQKEKCRSLKWIRRR